MSSLVDTGPHVLPAPGVLDVWCREGLRIVFGCLTGQEKSWRCRPRRSRSCSRRGSVAESRGLDGRFVSTGPSPSRRRQDEDGRPRRRNRLGRPSCGLAVAARGDAADGAQDGDHR